MITVSADNKNIPVNMVEFSDGAITFNLSKIPLDTKLLWVVVDPSTPLYRVREELATFHDSLYHYGVDKFEHNVIMYLSLDYFPHARNDRVFEEGNPLMLQEFCEFVEDYLVGYDKIFSCDIHNNTIPKQVFGDKLHEKEQLQCFKESLPQDFNIDYDIVLSPDKGSREKARTIAGHLEVDIYNCEKERDISTGKIIRSVLPEGVDFSGTKVLIPDDLCDGGYTFIKLAELLKEAGAKQVDLYVTHLIASKSLDNFKGLIDNIYCYQTVGNYVNKQNVNDFNK